MSSNDSLDSITTTTTQLTVESRKHFFSFFTTLNFLVSIPETFLFVEFPPLSWGIFILYCFFSVYFLINTFVRRISSKFRSYLQRDLIFRLWQVIYSCVHATLHSALSVGWSVTGVGFIWLPSQERENPDFLFLFSVPRFKNGEWNFTKWLVDPSVDPARGTMNDCQLYEQRTVVSWSTLGSVVGDYHYLSYLS